MKKHIIILVIINCLILISLEGCLRFFSTSIFYHESALKKSIKFFEKRSPGIQILFLGDSRSLYSIDPEKIKLKKCIHNFAFPSDSVFMIYFKLKKYLKSNSLPSLETIVVQLDYKMLTSASRRNIEFRYNYYDFFSTGDIRNFSTGYELLKSIAFRYSYILRLSPFLKKPNFKYLSNEDIKKTGFSKKNNIVDMDNIKIKNKLKELNAHKFEFKKPLVHNLEFYKKIISLAQKYNIRIVFIQPPMYIKAPLSKLKKNDVYIRKLINEELGNIPLIDLCKHTYEFKNDFYMDETHLGYTASFYIGKIIADRLKSIFAS